MKSKNAHELLFGLIVVVQKILSTAFGHYSCTQFDRLLVVISFVLDNFTMLHTEIVARMTICCLRRPETK